MNILVSEVVGQFLDLTNLGKSEYARALRIAVRGWRQLNWDITGQVKTIRLEVNSDKTIFLPEDFLNIADFGIDNGNGGIQSYTRSTNFTSLDRLITSDPSNKVSNTKDIYPNGGYSYGIGSYNNIGYYNINLKERRIILSPDNTYTGTFVLKYISNGAGNCDDYEINELAQEALLTWIDWQWSKGDRRMGINEKRDKERQFYNEKSKARLRIKKITKSQMNKNSREAVKMSLKS
jgi:hypothetical protein